MGKGREVNLYNVLADPVAGNRVKVPVYVKTTPGCSKKATKTLTSVTESDQISIAKASSKVKN